MAARVRQPKKRGIYPDAILTFLADVGPSGATTDEIARYVEGAVHGSYSHWSLLAALNRMSKEYVSEADRRQKHVLDKAYEYRPVGANQYGTRVYRYRLAAGFEPARRVMPDELLTAETALEDRARKV